jgi:hypothetical protein
MSIADELVFPGHRWADIAEGILGCLGRSAVAFMRVSGFKVSMSLVIAGQELVGEAEVDNELAPAPWPWPPCPAWPVEVMKAAVEAAARSLAPKLLAAASLFTDGRETIIFDAVAAPAARADVVELVPCSVDHEGFSAFGLEVDGRVEDGLWCAARLEAGIVLRHGEREFYVVSVASELARAVDVVAVRGRAARRQAGST